MSSISNPFFFEPVPPPTQSMCSSGQGSSAAPSPARTKQQQPQHGGIGAGVQQQRFGQQWHWNGAEQQQQDEDCNADALNGEAEPPGERQQRRRLEWNKSGENDDGDFCITADDDRRRRQQQTCCVANPFTAEGSCHFESRMSQSMMDSLLSMCSSAEYPTFLTSSVHAAMAAADEPTTAAAATEKTAFGTLNAAGSGANISHSFTSKLLQDSGYRSVTSNSALEEELAAVERQRRAERDQRRQQRQQHRQQQMQQAKLRGNDGHERFRHRLFNTITNNTGDSSSNSTNNNSVPAFLRRTCSSAATGFTAAIRPPSWIGGILPASMPSNTSSNTSCTSAFASSLASTLAIHKKQQQQRQNFSAPRRTRSVGSAACHSLAAAAASTVQLPPPFLYSTGWMVEADMSGDDSPMGGGTGDGGTTTAGKDDCTVELSGQRQLGIERLRELLLSRFCFISGLRTASGHPVLTFPDSARAGGPSINFDDYQLLLDYLFQTQRDEELPCTSTSSASAATADAQPPALEWVLIVDRRQDRWSSVRTLLTFLLSYFPEPIHLVLLLKPEGVLQRAIEYGGYRTLLDGCEQKFRVLVCQSYAELRDCVGSESLTMDLGGSVRHNHVEWVAHRIDIERMKSSARVIAESLSEFGRCLRETELPNDVHSTERILELQQQERDAIKEDFRISIRKGMQLLQQVRQIDQSPFGEQLSPSRLQNVTAIERMIAQLQDTEKSFDTFWQKHRKRLLGCLQLRRFENEFRKLQTSFAKHALRLDEHREIGNSEASAERLSSEHHDYQQLAMADVGAARALRQRGLQELGGHELAELLNTQGSDSVEPKCAELARMADALEDTLERRAQVLEQSRQMHAQIGKANDWCRRGVELLSIAPLDLLSAGCSNNLAIYEHALGTLNDFLAEGEHLNMDALVRAAVNAMAHHRRPNKTGGSASDGAAATTTTTTTVPGSNAAAVNGLAILFSTTEASSLLAQVNERINDIRRLSRARQEALRKLSAERRAQQQQHAIDGGNAPETTITTLVGGGGAERRRQLQHGSGGGRPVQVVSPEKQPQPQQQPKNKDVDNGNNNKDKPQQRQFSLDSCHKNNDNQPHRHHHHKEKHGTTANNNNANGKSCCSSSSQPSTPEEAEDGSGQLVRANSTQSAGGGCNCSPGTMASSMLQMMDGTGNCNNNGNSKVDFVLDELLNTERNYVRELAEIVCHYVQPFEALEVNGSSQIPAAFRGQSDTLFGNIRELHDFHHSLLLPALLQQHAANSAAAHSVEGIAAVLSAQRQRLLALYRTYCRNKLMSEALRAEHGAEFNKFFMECQRRAGHLLPLSAYLLKPVQRITKYQLLLKELIRHCPDADQSQSVVQTALAQMLDVLAQINADMEQLHILGYPGDLRLLGPLRLQTECSVFVYKRSKSASVGSNGGGGTGACNGNSGNNNNNRRQSMPKGKHQKRHLFLFDGGVLFCKKRQQAVQFASEYYEHKQCIPMHILGFAECSRQNEERFELWDMGAEHIAYAIQPVDERARQKWIQRLARLTVLFNQQQQQQKIVETGQNQMAHVASVGGGIVGIQSSLPSFYPSSPTAGTKTPRPQSWTTTSSSEDGCNTVACIGMGDAAIVVENSSGSNSSVHSSSNRSSTSSTSSSCCSSSAVIFEEKCHSNNGGHNAIIKNAIDDVPSVATPTTETTAKFMLDQCSNDCDEKEQQQQQMEKKFANEQQRSQSQPPMLESADVR